MPVDNFSKVTRALKASVRKIGKAAEGQRRSELPERPRGVTSMRHDYPMSLDRERRKNRVSEYGPQHAFYALSTGTGETVVYIERKAGTSPQRFSSVARIQRHLTATGLRKVVLTDEELKGARCCSGAAFVHNRTLYFKVTNRGGGVTPGRLEKLLKQSPMFKAIIRQSRLKFSVRDPLQDFKKTREQLQDDESRGIWETKFHYIRDNREAWRARMSEIIKQAQGVVSDCEKEKARSQTSSSAWQKTLYSLDKRLTQVCEAWLAEMDVLGEIHEWLSENIRDLNRQKSAGVGKDWSADWTALRSELTDFITLSTVKGSLYYGRAFQELMALQQGQGEQVSSELPTVLFGAQTWVRIAICRTRAQPAADSPLGRFIAACSTYEAQERGERERYLEVFGDSQRFWTLKGRVLEAVYDQEVLARFRRLQKTDDALQGLRESPGKAQKAVETLMRYKALLHGKRSGDLPPDPSLSLLKTLADDEAASQSSLKVFIDHHREIILKSAPGLAPEALDEWLENSQNSASLKGVVENVEHYTAEQERKRFEEFGGAEKIAGIRTLILENDRASRLEREKYADGALADGEDFIDPDEMNEKFEAVPEDDEPDIDMVEALTSSLAEHDARIAAEREARSQRFGSFFDRLALYRLLPEHDFGDPLVYNTDTVLTANDAEYQPLFARALAVEEEIGRVLQDNHGGGIDDALLKQIDDILLALIDEIFAQEGSFRHIPTRNMTRIQTERQAMRPDIYEAKDQYLDAVIAVEEARKERREDELLLSDLKGVSSHPELHVVLHGLMTA